MKYVCVNCMIMPKEFQPSLILHLVVLKHMIGMLQWHFKLIKSSGILCWDKDLVFFSDCLQSIAMNAQAHVEKEHLLWEWRVRLRREWRVRLRRITGDQHNQNQWHWGQATIMNIQCLYVFQSRNPMIYFEWLYFV